MKERKDAEPARRRRFEALAARLAKTGWMVQGSVQARRRGAAAAGTAGSKRYGPYYQWSFKRDGKTVTVQLSPAQAQAFARAVTENRRIERLLARLRVLSEQFLTATIQGVPKRNRRQH